MTALKDRIIKDLAQLESKSDLQNILAYLNFLKEKEEWDETLEIMNDKRQMKKIKQSLADIQNGDVVDFADVKEDV